MDADLCGAIDHLHRVFAGHRRRPVLDGCPHCRGPVTVDHHDLFSLSISLGNTVGTEDDRRSLLPTMLEELVTGTTLDPTVVLGALAGRWRVWPDGEQRAVDAYLHAVWAALLRCAPTGPGSFTGAADFLTAVNPLYDHVDEFLDRWTHTDGPAADRHLATVVVGWTCGEPTPAAVQAWLRGPGVRERLAAAFDRDHDQPWADDLARAYDLLGPVG